MTDYKRKKKLLDDNKDIYISDYDKNLSYDALSRIVDAKKNYMSAAKAGDKKGMTESNDLANAIRAKYGNYTAGDFGDEYHPFVYTEAPDYESKYDDILDRLYDDIFEGKSEFTYDYTKDPAYLAYKDVYEKEGALAYQRALSKNSLKTGGVENSNAQSAAAQALGYYNSLLASKIPELYEAAYDRHYKDEGNRLDRIKQAYNIVSDRENNDYSRYTDKLDYLSDIRDFEYDKSKDILDRDLKLSQSLDDQKNDKANLIYDILRDEMDDQKWQANYNLSAYRAKYPSYKGSVGTAGLLEQARKLFGNSNLTMEDLYNLLGL